MMLTLITWLRRCLPRLSTVELLFFPLQPTHVFISWLPQKAFFAIWQRAAAACISPVVGQAIMASR